MDSEICPISTLEMIFKSHPIWPRMKEMLPHGSQWPMDPLDKVLCQVNIKEALSFGNHKVASKNLTLWKAMNIQDQHTIDKYGRIIDKKWLTHDQSHKWGSNTSVNNRIMKEFLMPCIYGSCLQRLINWMVTARRKFPSKRIMAGKIDFISAFHRYHLAAQMAIQCCTQLPVKELLLLYLHLTFGGCPCLNEWGAFSEPICDLVVQFYSMIPRTLPHFIHQPKTLSHHQKL